MAGATTGAAGPASSFGHSLLRLNTEDGSASDGLVDLGVNFGALVPDGESTLVYVVKGLSGGYQAGFSDKPYYAHDLMYSRTEFRDMWDYALDLVDAERMMLVYHLWEIVGIETRRHCGGSEQPMCHDLCGTIATVW